MDAEKIARLRERYSEVPRLSVRVSCNSDGDPDGFGLETGNGKVIGGIEGMENEHLAFLLAEAPALIPALLDEVERLREALKKAVEVIRAWHGLGLTRDSATEKRAWDLYWLNAPEMKPIRDALEEAQRAKDEVPKG